MPSRVLCLPTTHPGFHPTAHLHYINDVSLPEETRKQVGSTVNVGRHEEAGFLKQMIQNYNADNLHRNPEHCMKHIHERDSQLNFSSSPVTSVFYHDSLVTLLQVKVTELHKQKVMLHFSPLVSFSSLWQPNKHSNRPPSCPAILPPLLHLPSITLSPLLLVSPLLMLFFRLVPPPSPGSPSLFDYAVYPQVQTSLCSFLYSSLYPPPLLVRLPLLPHVCTFSAAVLICLPARILLAFLQCWTLDTETN